MIEREHITTPERTNRLDSSFIIPALNEEELIAKCIKSIKRQSEPPYEIVVVDNGCIDKTTKIATQLGCRVVEEERRGISHARNKGAEVAEGNILCFIDADGIVSQDWLKRAQTALSDGEVKAVSGLNIFMHEKYAKKVWYNVYTVAAHSGLFLQNLLLNKLHLSGNNMAIRKEIFQELGGFQPVIGEDVWLSKEFWKLEEHKGVFDPGMIVYLSSRGFETFGYLRTVFYWMKGALTKAPQGEYSYKNKRF